MMRMLGLVLIASLVGCASSRSDVPPAPTTQPAPGEESMLSDIRQLTSGFSRAGEAYFSPDMKRIIFQATPSGERHYQMYYADLELRDGQIVGTSHPIWISRGRLLSPSYLGFETTSNTCGYFAPDGRSLIFASTMGSSATTQPTTAPGYQRASGTYRWEMPAGMEIFRAAPYWKAPKPLTKNNAYDAECAYSPNGKWIVFASNRTGDVELYVMRPDGSDPVQLTRAKGYDGGPFFSPDGKRLVYRSDRAGNDLLQVFTADLVFDGSGNITGIANERQLTSGGDVNWAPYWHPDGRHIIYTTSRHGHANYELYLMRDDGTNQTRITRHGSFDGLPVFSPDGKYLMWSSKRTSDNTTQVFLARFTLPNGA